MTELVERPAALKIVRHEEYQIEILLRLSVVDDGDLVVARANRASEQVVAVLVGTERVEHRAQLRQQGSVGGAIALGVAHVRVGALAAGKLPIEVDAVKELPGDEVLLHRVDKRLARRLVVHVEERVGQRPAADRGQHFEVRVGALQRHQLAKVALVRLVPRGHAFLRFLYGRPRIVDGHLEVGAAGARSLQRLEAARHSF
ncbi:hypothetical protein pesp020 [Peridroma alphabaculovirus]|uniref:Uncharacterized protein n=1 Tax=Peridroma alphabaculovirus TaxID=1346829 RepID=A0A068LMH0_9ABAC|nr:hypothetical protein pesp020 [Peridroma alphabaculovirus]AIE47751.1 hypothetical protein pesp020 [Peridroma alphabaculovirus]